MGTLLRSCHFGKLPYRDIMENQMEKGMEMNWKLALHKGCSLFTCWHGCSP